MFAAMALAWCISAQSKPSPDASTRNTVSSDANTFVLLRLASGAEYDTNAFRSVSGSRAGIGGSRQTRVLGDGLQRTVFTLRGGATLGDQRQHKLLGNLSVGTKQFWQQSSEDFIAQDFSLRFQSRINQYFLTAVYGQAHISRIQNEQRNYNLGRFGTRFTWLASPLELSISAHLQTFAFLPETNFSYEGFGAAVGAKWSMPRSMSLDVHVRHRRRYYPSRLVLVPPSGEGEQPPVLVFCNDPLLDPASTFCDTSAHREDSEYIASFGARYRGRFLASLRYQIAIQRSNSALENVDRHRVEGSISIALPHEFNLTGRGSLQVNNGFTPTDQQFLAEDDENQNAIQVQLQRPLSRIIRAEFRYSLFMNQFGTADAQFQRHVIYLGLALHSKPMNN